MDPIDTFAAMEAIEINKPVFDYDYWQNKLAGLSKNFLSATPFKYVVIDDFFDAGQLETVLAEFKNFQSGDWINYTHFNERKRGFNQVGEFPAAIAAFIKELNSLKFTALLSQITGIPSLMGDNGLEGGGMHETFRGGFLNIHTDFASHPHKSQWRRQINLLVYLNEDWQDSWKGDLEFWNKDMSKCIIKVKPVFNRCVIFKTDAFSYHGHPDPLNCPADISRRSIALYYFTEEQAEIKVLSTNYKARPQDASRRWLISFDNFIIRFYTITKRKLGINDRFLSSLLRLFTRRR